MSSHHDRLWLRLLPGRPASNRSALTCRYRCGDACAHRPPNPTRTATFADVVEGAVSRRGFLRAGAVISLSGLGVSAVAACGSEPAAPPGPDGAPPAPAPRGLDFTPVPPNTEDGLRVPPGYAQRVVISWGEPLLPGAPPFDFDNQTAEAQAAQFGYNCDFTGLVPLGQGRWLMTCNHEYTTEPLMFRGYDPENPTEAQVRIALAAHGMSVLVVERDPGGGLRRVPDAAYDRRVTAFDELTLTGPAAGSELLRTAADPTGTTVLGTLNNCAGGVTPWGTILSGEENFNQYFANAGLVTDPPTRERFDRYGFEEGASDRQFERFEPRYDIAQEPNEPNRFGWTVELDPHDPASPVVKHTALGRFKHEGATIRLAGDGRAVAYMGDDEVFEYVYKFVSDSPVDAGTDAAARRRNMTLLDAGTLYVARFSGEGSGEWIPLARGTESFVPGMSAEEVYVFTRLAGDKVGATKMDRPEDVQPNPSTGRVYLALTNNDERGVGAAPPPGPANPRATNKHGHVIELEEAGGDAAATGFAWRILLLAGDPADPSTYFAGFDKSQVSPISCPDNLAFDPHGNLWISTDGNELGFNDGLYGVALEGPARGLTKLFATVPIGAEACGPVIADEYVLISPQHPGEDDQASVENPVSTWPPGGIGQPRPSVAVVYREGGGPIGA